MFKKEQSKKISWLQLVIVFILGILIASNGFLLRNNLALKQEVARLKADDLALAQVINNILSQIKPVQNLPAQPVTPQK